MCYVYGLFDPNTNELFYIGKGTNQRDKSHLKPYKWKNPKSTTNPFLYFKIQSLMQKNTPPLIRRLFEDIDENKAYEIEEEIIKKYGRRFIDEGGKLFNISDNRGGSEVGRLKPWSEYRRKKHRRKCRETRVYDPSYEELYNEYIIKNMTREQIAALYGVSEPLVKFRLRDMGIKKPKILRYPRKNILCCLECKSKIIVPSSVKRRFCSRMCYIKNRYGENIVS